MSPESYEDLAKHLDRAEEHILAELTEQTIWLRFLGIQAILPVLEDVLETSKQRAIYELSNGRRGVREIAQLAGVGAGSVSRLWNLWAELGLVAPSREVPGRWRHMVSLRTANRVDREASR